MSYAVGFTRDGSDLGPSLRVMLFASQACSPGVRPTRTETKAMVKLLLERGADVNGADKNGNTAISEAAAIQTAKNHGSGGNCGACAAGWARVTSGMFPGVGW